MRVGFDTNSIVSMALAKGGTMHELRQKWRDGRFSVLSSREFLEEVKDVLEYPRLDALLTPALKQTALEELESLAERVLLKNSFPVFEADEDDRYLLAMVRDGEADCLVTGDKKLLDLRSFEGKPILTAAQFVALLEEDQ